MWWGLLAVAVGVGEPSVRWDAPAQCPSPPDARARIVAELDPGGDLEVSATVRAVDEGFAATVAVRSEDGETTRELSSPSCETLLDAVALIAAAAQSEQESREAETETETETEIETEIETETETETGGGTGTETAGESEAGVEVVSDDGGRAARPPATPGTPKADPPPLSATRRAIALHGRAFGRIGWGLTPRFDFGGGLAVGLTWRRLRAEVFGGAVAPTEAPIDALPGAIARVYAWSLGVRGCGVVWAGPGPRETVTLPICGAFEAGQVIGEGEGEGLEDTRTHRGARIGARVGPAIVVQVTRFLSFVADVELVASLVRPGFQVRGADDDVHRTRPAGVSATLGIELHFPRRISRPGGIQ